MIESVLTRKNVSVKLKITVKMLVSTGIIALAIGLPQLVHAVAGAQGGAQWLPMYLPVLLGGCLLGWQWGLGIGIVSPLLSFGITSLAGNAMPVAVKLHSDVITVIVRIPVPRLYCPTNPKVYRQIQVTETVPAAHSKCFICRAVIYNHIIKSRGILPNILNCLFQIPLLVKGGNYH